MTKDTGCELAASCLECPLTECKYDKPISLSRRRIRNRKIRESGKTVPELAKEFGLSRKTVYRILGRRSYATRA